MIYRCSTILVGMQNPPPLAAPVSFDTRKTLATTVPETCGGAMRRADQCDEGQFCQYRVVAEHAQSKVKTSLVHSKSCLQCTTPQDMKIIFFIGQRGWFSW